MSLEDRQLEEAYAIQLHPMGASRIRQLRDVVPKYLEALMEGKKVEWVVVAVRASFEEAEKELKRIRKRMREKGKKSE